MTQNKKPESGPLPRKRVIVEAAMTIHVEVESPDASEEDITAALVAAANGAELDENHNLILTQLTDNIKASEEHRNAVEAFGYAVSFHRYRYPNSTIEATPILGVQPPVKIEDA